MNTTISIKLDAFFTKFQHQVYKKGEMLIRADDDPPGIFYLKNGSVKQYVISKNGNELVLNIYKPVAFFPMSWAINNIPNNYYFGALTDVEVWRAPKQKVLDFIKSNPDVLYDLMSRVYRGIDGLLIRMMYLMSGSAYARLISELLIYTKRFGMIGQDGSLSVKITETDMATSAGMTRETVSREMKVLKEKGFVKFNKSILILKDLTKLEEELTTPNQ